MDLHSMKNSSINKSFFLAVIWILIAVIFAACKKDNLPEENEEPETGTASTEQMQVQGKQRNYTLYKPDGLEVQRPLLIVLHGDNGTGKAIKDYTHFEQIADEEKFLIVYPDAINGIWEKDINAENNSDVAFVNDLIVKLAGEYQIDSRKVYATGHSGGAFFCYTLAVKLPSDRIAAIAPYAGNMYGDEAFLQNFFANTYNSPMFKRKAICHLHGDADQTVAYPDADHAPQDWGEWPLATFSNINCGKATYSATEDIVPQKVKKLVFCPGATPADKKIELIRFIGQGHGWPDIQGFDTEQYIWDFCKIYSTN